VYVVTQQTCSAIEDFHQLENLHNIMPNKNVAIVGGGFLGQRRTHTHAATPLAVELSFQPHPRLGLMTHSHTHTLTHT
jgi:hypothetical protein